MTTFALFESWQHCDSKVPVPKIVVFPIKSKKTANSTILLTNRILLKGFKELLSCKKNPPFILFEGFANFQQVKKIALGCVSSHKFCQEKEVFTKISFSFDKVIELPISDVFFSVKVKVKWAIKLNGYRFPIANGTFYLHLISCLFTF